MKILFDPITTNDPQFCVMNYKFKILARYLLDEFDDVFIHWIIPDEPIPGMKIWDIDPKWLIDDPRVKYHRVPTFRDRTREYYYIHPKMKSILDFHGDYFDIDIIITCRIPMVPSMTVLRTPTRSVTKQLTHRIYTVDDMPLTSEKKHKVMQDSLSQDLMAIMGYFRADDNFQMSFWIDEVIMNLARRHLSPSNARDLRKRMIKTSPILSYPPDAPEGTPYRMSLKSPEDIEAIHTHERPFTTGFTQRFETIHRGCQKVMDLFTKHWVYNPGGGKKMRFVITSNTKNAGKFVDTEFMQTYRAPREEFWRMMREEMCVTIVMTLEDEYSLSLLEPIMLGVPAVVLRKRYAEGTLTKDYPFFVANEAEAYAMVSAFYEDYKGMYEKFAKWFEESFVPEMLRRNEFYWPHLMKDRLIAYKKKCAKEGPDLPDNQIARLVLEHGEKEFHLRDLLLGDLKEKLGSLAIKMEPEKTDRFPYAYMPALNDYRAVLMHRHGFRDASIATGHLVKDE